MRVNIAIPEAHVSKPVLDAALEAVTRLNEDLIAGGAPTADQLIEQGAKWRPEPPGQEHFDHANILAHRGWGDCDDWAPLHAASLRATGKDPGAIAEVVKSGPSTWHAIVKRSDGSHDDPSKAAGMGQHGARGVHGAVLPLMNAPSQSVVGGAYIVRPSIAVRPSPNGFQGRVDLPWHWREHLDDKPTPTDYAMTALHTAPIAATALSGALEGAIELGEAGGFADDEHLERLAAISDACNGATYQDLVEMYGPQHAQAAQQVVGSFFGDAFKAVKSAVTSPVTSAVQFVKHPSLSNLAAFGMSPMMAQTHLIPNVVKRAAAPIASTLAPMARMVPGPWGSFAGAGLDFLAQGMPTDPAALAAIAARNATAFIPGGGLASMAMPSGLPSFASQAPQMFQQHAPQMFQRPHAPQVRPMSLYERAMMMTHGQQPWPRGFS